MWTFRVLHVLRQQLSQSGVSAHYHLSTDARDEQTIATLTPLFDAVVTVNEQGEWRSTV